MSRRRPDSGPAISLFPFLAVLLCTMGSLLVLLVIFSRRAGDSRTAAAAEAARARSETLAADRDELAWRVEQLAGIRDRTAADLARARMQLAGVEEDSRRLADELDDLEREAAALAERRPQAEPEAAQAAVADLERRLAEDREALAKARAEEGERPAFAVVPYAGKNGTRRRPLYIECCIDGVFLQPEGIRLGPADFEGPPGPGNPLASALRAAREHIARQPGESGDPDAQPYPLLLVRPSGVMAYYAAREAIQSWGNEFGYQFVDEDWQLTFPGADPALAAVEQRAIDESRRRLAWLAQSRPPRAARPPQLYRASPGRGGVVADGGPSVLGDQSRFEWTEETAAAGRDGGGPGGAGDVILGGGGRPGAAAPGGDAGGRYAGPSRFYSAAPGEQAAGGDGSGPGAGGGPGIAPLAGVPEGTGGPAPTGARFGAAHDGGSAAGSGDVAGGGAAAGPQAGGGGATGAGGQGAGGQAGADGQTGGQPGAAGQSGGGGAGPSLPGLASAGGGGSSGQAAAGAAGASASLAGARGSNWASLATADRPIPLTRPIRIECAAGEFRILDDAGGRVERRIPIGTETVTAIDPLVQSIHARVAGWGLAGHRMYWKPELILSETPDGAGRRADLERLLVDSGLDTRRRDADDVVRGLPPVDRTSGLAPPQRR